MGRLNSKDSHCVESLPTGLSAVQTSETDVVSSFKERKRVFLSPSPFYCRLSIIDSITSGNSDNDLIVVSLLFTP